MLCSVTQMPARLADSSLMAMVSASRAGFSCVSWIASSPQRLHLTSLEPALHYELVLFSPGVFLCKSAFLSPSKRGPSNSVSNLTFPAGTPLAPSGPSLRVAPASLFLSCHLLGPCRIHRLPTIPSASSFRTVGVATRPASACLGSTEQPLRPGLLQHTSQAPYAWSYHLVSSDTPSLCPPSLTQKSTSFWF